MKSWDTEHNTVADKSNAKQTNQFTKYMAIKIDEKKCEFDKDNLNIWEE